MNVHGYAGFSGQLSHIFVFPRTTPIELRHKSIEFVTKLGGIRIRKKFSLKKMVFEGKLEL